MEGVQGKRQNLYSSFDPVAYLPWDFPFSEPWVFTREVKAEAGVSDKAGAGGILCSGTF